MAVLVGAALALTTWAEVAGRGAVPAAAGAAMEGKETQFGIWASALFAASTTGTSTGAVNAMHDSMTAAGGAWCWSTCCSVRSRPAASAPGLYGILIAAIVAVFIAGLMVGRTPELLGKKIGAQEMTLVAGYVLASPALVLIGLGVAMALPSTPDAMANTGGHGFSEVFYAYASAANNNGSAFAGLTVTSTFFQLTLAAAMLLGRFVPMVLVHRPGRPAGRRQHGARLRRHPAHPHPLVRLAARRSDRARQWSHLLPGPRAGPDRGGAVMTALHPAPARRRGRLADRRAPHRPRRSAGHRSGRARSRGGPQAGPAAPVAQAR